MSELPAETRPARLRVEASPRPPGARKPETELGAVSTTAVPHPDSRSGPARICKVGLWTNNASVFVGIDVSKDRLDVHLRPSGEAFCVPREGKGMDDLVIRLQWTVRRPCCTGGDMAALRSHGCSGPGQALGCRSVSLTRTPDPRDFARAMGRLAKTDTLDAEVIALSRRARASTSTASSGT